VFPDNSFLIINDPPARDAAARDAVLKGYSALSAPALETLDLLVRGRAQRIDPELTPSLPLVDALGFRA
jgi:hypothetical protein